MPATPPHDEDDRTTGPSGPERLRASASRIWLAGLGALARAQQEGGKAFDTLVQEGQAWQRRTQAAAGERMNEAGQRMSGVAAGLSGRAAGQWERVEARIEDGIARGLARLGVPTREEMDALHARVDHLEDALAEAQERLDEFERERVSALGGTAEVTDFDEDAASGRSRPSSPAQDDPREPY
ncbi:phasin family protein [Ramlibacter sp. AN1015]|uniref:phasin family protein n=1 Tax=Ramlibacter sp. AN1015 TaxID=3133428 RepID=UPI0030C10CE6